MTWIIRSIALLTGGNPWKKTIMLGRVLNFQQRYFELVYKLNSNWITLFIRHLYEHLVDKDSLKMSQLPPMGTGQKWKRVTSFLKFLFCCPSFSYMYWFRGFLLSYTVSFSWIPFHFEIEWEISRNLSLVDGSYSGISWEGDFFFFFFLNAACPAC